MFILFLFVLDCLQVQGCSWHGKNNNKLESVYLLLRRSNPTGCCSRTANVESFPKSKLPHPLIERSGSTPAISVGLRPSTPALTNTGMLAQSTRKEATTVSEQAPSLCHAVVETGPPSGDDRYGDPSSKYGPTRQVYDPTHYKMVFMTVALTFEAVQANEGHDPRARESWPPASRAARRPTT